MDGAKTVVECRRGAPVKKRELKIEGVCFSADLDFFEPQALRALKIAGYLRPSLAGGPHAVRDEPAMIVILYTAVAAQT
jgi:hypothetical protein